MHTEAEAFLQRIRAYPDDDAQRLIFADWLDEQGDPRGRFIRVQLALAELTPASPAWKALAAQDRELQAAHRAEWEAPFRGLATGLVFRRGFVDEANVDARVFVRAAAELFAAAPIRHVHVQNIGDALGAVMQCPYLGRLRALTVHAQYSGEPLARAVARSEHVAALRRLTLTRDRLTDDAVEHLARSPHLANLEELDLSENEVGETGARALAASPHLANLRRLEVCGNRLGPAGAEAVAGSDRLAGLSYLGLAQNDVGLPRLLTLSRAYTLLHVPALNLSANGLTAAGLQAILGRPQGAEAEPVRLSELDLGHNRELGDDGARVLAGCPHLSGLTALRLADCGIGDAGGQALARAAHLNAVERLDLESNPLNDAGLRPWLDARHWRGLRHLHLPRVGVSVRLRADLDCKFNRR